ncbi:hypothetical protein EGR_10377 [Echinococcus granulosus]|uniref:Uncharacterized protein n=1 Tax=Echinococcus granulosus TaxID=6210 RepID=W6U141_ECHGR|nr:hypothetical protein EGR_10377 [Echinococcus granulosus]EUB54758.1 hypothetical protein EGR_10377 [Echinococcus granulosus]
MPTAFQLDTTTCQCFRVSRQGREKQKAVIQALISQQNHHSKESNEVQQMDTHTTCLRSCLALTKCINETLQFKSTNNVELLPEINSLIVATTILELILVLPTIIKKSLFVLCQLTDALADVFLAKGQTTKHVVYPFGLRKQLWPVKHSKINPISIYSKTYSNAVIYADQWLNICSVEDKIRLTIEHKKKGREKIEGKLRIAVGVSNQKAFKSEKIGPLPHFIVLKACLLQDAPSVNVVHTS